MIKNILLVFIGGGLGSVMRYTMTLFISKFHYTAKFPLNTFLCNTMGSLLIGLIMGYWNKNQVMETYLFLVVGCLGGFTTFSAFSLETISLLKQGNFIIAIMYILISIFLCLLFTLLGFWCTR